MLTYEILFTGDRPMMVVKCDWIVWPSENESLIRFGRVDADGNGTTFLALAQAVIEKMELID